LPDQSNWSGKTFLGEAAQGWCAQSGNLRASVGKRRARLCLPTDRAALITSRQRAMIFGCE
jgi:hypothetical protein